MSGIKAHTLRIWEQRYDFIRPERKESRIRYYSNEELRLILNVALLNKYGFKVSQINLMSQVEMQEKILTLDHPNAQQERIVFQLIQCMVNLDIESMEEILDNYILSRGIEKTILQIVFPFLERVGILWQSARINPAQEHMVSNLLRQKLIVGIEGVQPILKINKTILLFMPEGEFHEMGLLFMHFLLKSSGAKVIYLGSNVPLKDVLYVANVKNPDYLYVHLTTGSNFSFDKFLIQINKIFPSVPTVISGKIAVNYEKKIMKPISLIKGFEEAMTFVRSL